MNKTNEIASFSHIMVSQDRDEIYISSASWHPDYISYLKGGEVTPMSHLEMRTAGPWYTGQAAHMQNFAAVVAAILLSAKYSEEVRSSSGTLS